MAAEAVAAPAPSAGGELKTAVRHTITWGIGGILAKVVSFCMLPYFTHHLGPRDYGLLEILDLTMSLVGLILAMGTAPWIIRRYHLARSQREQQTLLSSTLVFTGAVAAIFLSSGLLFIRPASMLLLGPDIPWYYLYLSFTQILIGYVGGVPYTYIRAREASRDLVLIDVVGTFVLLSMTVYSISGLHLGVLGMLISSVVCNVLKVFTLVLWVRRDLTASLDLGQVRSLIAFGAPLILSNLTMFALNFSDRFFLQRFASLEAVGIYAVAYKFGYMLNFLLIHPFNTMWQVRMYVIHRRADHQQVFALVSSLYFTVLVFAALAMALFSPEIMAVAVDARFHSGAPLVGLIAASYAVFGAAQYFQTGMYLAARTGPLSVMSACVAVLTLVANLVLIRNFGPVGAAWATFIGFVLLAAGSYYCSQKSLPLQFQPARTACVVAAAVGLYWVSCELPPVPLFVAVLEKMALLTLFPVVLWKTGVFRKEELAVMEGAVRNILARMPRVAAVAGAKE